VGGTIVSSVRTKKNLPSIFFECSSSAFSTVLRTVYNRRHLGSSISQPFVSSKSQTGNIELQQLVHVYLLYHIEIIYKMQIMKPNILHRNNKHRMWIIARMQNPMPKSRCYFTYMRKKFMCSKNMDKRAMMYCRCLDIVMPPLAIKSIPVFHMHTSLFITFYFIFWWHFFWYSILFNQMDTK